METFLRLVCTLACWGGFRGVSHVLLERGVVLGWNLPDVATDPPCIAFTAVHQTTDGTILLGANAAVLA